MTRLRVPALIGVLVVAPLMVLELMNRRHSPDGFPLPLFVLLWVLAAAFSFVLTSVLRDLRVGGLWPPHAGPWLRIACLVLIVWLWVGIALDQMPCFLGAPTCD